MDKKIPPPFVVAIFALAILASANFLPIIGFPFQGLIAIVFFIAGFLVSGVAAALFHKHKTTIDPRKPEESKSLVVEGIFQHTRNPMYLGLLIMLIGFSFYVSILGGLIFVPLFGLYITKFQIIPEEKALENLFGEDFVAYKSKVRRWI